MLFVCSSPGALCTGSTHIAVPASSQQAFRTTVGDVSVSQGIWHSTFSLLVSEETFPGFRKVHFTFHLKLPVVT